MKASDAPRTGTLHTSVESQRLAGEASMYNNQALMLSNQGDLSGAERLHLKALDLKLRGMGPNAFSTSITFNALGELYVTMGRLNDAENNFNRAIKIRDSQPGSNYAFDAAVSRENLAQVYEIRGDLVKAKEIRLSAGKLNIACGHFQCPMTTFKKKELANCSRCRAIYYCSPECQKSDWSRHKKFCKSPSADPK